MKTRPAIKVSFALMLLTSSILIIGDLLSLVPNERDGILEGRKKFCESLAIQVSLAAMRNDFDLINATLKAVVDRNPDVRSAALRTFKGDLVSEAGNHAKNWTKLPKGKSTPRYVQVPILIKDVQWGTMEVAFERLLGQSFAASLSGSFVGLLLFVSVSGFILYFLFIKKIARELDPRSVIPERVKSAFNALAEGLLILDERENIVLANSAFAEKVQMPVETLVGVKASTLAWKVASPTESELPWYRSLKEQEHQIGIPLKFQSSDNKIRTFMVNAAPILDVKGTVRGVLSTFDDMTNLEKKHTELKQTIGQLYKSQEQLLDKTLELEYLATRDPLTGCLNRRAFLEKYEDAFSEATNRETALTCVMMDLDHFKSINDRFGHATGDKVLKYVSEMIRSHSRPGDLIGRYGGEEFCLAFPDTDLKHAIATAEHLRREIHVHAPADVKPAVRITASLGVAELTKDIADSGDLINRADKALYLAKEAGRNRVIEWQPKYLDSHPILTDEYKELVVTRAADESVVRPPDHQARASSGSELLELRNQVKILEEELEYHRERQQSHDHDHLTGLPVRMVFIDRIRQALSYGYRHGRFAALVYLDIDSFKRVNDTLGEVVGDQLLRAVATRLVGELRSVDTVSLIGNGNDNTAISRLHRDEFGILLTDLTEVESIAWIVKRLFESLSAKFAIDGHDIFITCSAGISIFPHDGNDAEVLLRAASAARTDAKHRIGHNNLQFFSSEINKTAYRQLWLESQLHRALESDELLLHYQPTVSIDTGRIRSLEALIRWGHPKLGLIPPIDFIGIAEHTGLINKVGTWVLRSACQQAREWYDEGFNNIQVAVNLSPAQFRDESLAQEVISILEETNLPARSLNLEITESTLIENFSGAIKTINELHRVGVSFSIDDFGTGYSSLSYLKSLPVDWVKIDRSFLSDVLPSQQDQNIIGAIISMSHSLGLKVVAEGVESDSQCDLLQTLNCDEIQGFLISTPLQPAQATQFLRNYNLREAKSSVA
jgi:diguanylate cyclase (GGDEF)-like protein/PAS domain S-box-containing protein